MKLNKTIILKRLLPTAIGALLGFAYYYYIGCDNGCLIQSNPYLSSFYGALIAFTLSMPSSKKRKRVTEIEDK